MIDITEGIEELGNLPIDKAIKKIQTTVKACRKHFLGPIEIKGIRQLVVVANPKWIQYLRNMEAREQYKHKQWLSRFLKRKARLQLSKGY